MTWKERLDEIDEKADHLDLLLILGVVCFSSHLLIRIVAWLIR